MNKVDRYLVDKKYVFKDGKEYYQLYFYDPMDGVIVTILAPIFDKSTKPMSVSFNENSIAELQLRSKQIKPDNTVSDE